MCIRDRDKGDADCFSVDFLKLKAHLEDRFGGSWQVAFRYHPLPKKRNLPSEMCIRDSYKAPSKPEEEISMETIKKLPKMYFTNITGGEPVIRTDLKDIVRELFTQVNDTICEETVGGNNDTIRPVSYTHLDVYKRQIHISLITLYVSSFSAKKTSYLSKLYSMSPVPLNAEPCHVHIFT